MNKISVRLRFSFYNKAEECAAFLHSARHSAANKKVDAESAAAHNQARRAVIIILLHSNYKRSAK
jgi:hypothetical protein